MDYSLLLVVETVKDYSLNQSLVCEPPKESRNLIRHGDKIFHIGIIDYLQAWNLSKKIENKWKSKKPDKLSDISAVSPWPYYHRFREYAKKHIFKK